MSSSALKPPFRPSTQNGGSGVSQRASIAWSADAIRNPKPSASYGQALEPGQDRWRAERGAVIAHRAQPGLLPLAQARGRR